jgi:hypothetical protein
MTVDNKPMGEIYHNGYMYDYIYNLYVYNNFWNYSHNTAYLQYMTYVVYQLHVYYKKCRSECTIWKNVQIWPTVPSKNGKGPQAIMGHNW